MRSLFFGFIVFILYAIVARYYYVCKIKQNCSDEYMNIHNTEIPKTLALYYKDTFLLNEYDQFKFEFGKFDVSDYTRSNNAFLDSVVTLLKEYPDKNIEITGFMREKEIDLPSRYGENIGHARAIKVSLHLHNNGIAPRRIKTTHEVHDGQLLLEPVQFRLLDE